MRKYAYIDAIRGYAILLVIASHTFYAYPQQPTPVRLLATLGFLGVQLFFVVSSLTLAMSWASRVNRDQAPVPAFLIRRVFRIAPAYFAGFALYLFVTPPGNAFSWQEALATLTFTHGWSPGLLPTTTGGWAAIPGSWSVAVEFSFYLLFPLLVTVITSLRRAIASIVFFTLLGLVLNRVGMAWYVGAYGERATDQFIYYWLPNQLPVFLCGFAAFFLLRGRAVERWSPWITRHASLLAVAAAFGFMVLAYVPLSRVPTMSFPFLPQHLVAAFAFVAFTIAAAHAAPAWWLGRPIVLMGQASFSAYLLHFAVLDLMVRYLPGVFQVGAVGFAAIAHSVLLFVVVTVLTFLLSSMAHRLIETPMIRLGGHVVRRLRFAEMLPQEGRVVANPSV